MQRVGRIFDIQPFSLHDGPGTRTTVFLQGCNLRCAWCHNPESQPVSGALLFRAGSCIGCGACAEVCPHALGGKSARHTANCALCGACAEACYADSLTLAGREIGCDALVEMLLADRSIYETSGGGVTVSGGEPLLQAEFVSGLFARLQEEGIHTAIESALHVPWEDVSKVAMHTDLFLADLKCVSDDAHRAGTGVGNARILENIRRLSESGAQMILRVPVVPGFNADDGEIVRIAAFVAALPQRHAVELLAYHGMCAAKYTALSRDYMMTGAREPDANEMEREQGIEVRSNI